MSGTKGFADQLRDVLFADRLQNISLEGDVVLEEENHQQRDDKMCFKVTSLPISSTVVKIGLLQHLAGVKNVRDLRKICDYLLVIPTGNQWSAVLIEMKKTLEGKKILAMEQLCRSIPVVKYLESLCAIESQRDWEVVMHYVVVAEKYTRLDKDLTRPVAAPRPQREEHKGISIAFFDGYSRTAKELLAG